MTKSHVVQLTAHQSSKRIRTEMEVKANTKKLYFSQLAFAQEINPTLRYLPFCTFPSKLLSASMAECIAL